MLQIVIAIALFGYLAYWLMNRNSYFINRGINGPRQLPIFGNVLDMFTSEHITPLLLKEWSQKYGKTYGYYEGPTPVLVTSDVAVLNDVFIKQFPLFHGRKRFALQPHPDKDPKASLFTSRGLRWKRLRAISSPTFSTGNLKLLMPILNESTDQLLQRLMDDKKERSFDIYPFYQELTLDVITKVAFGYSDDVQGSISNPYLAACREVFAPTRRLISTVVILLCFLIPEGAPVWRKALRAFRRLFAMPNPTVELESKLELAVVDRKRVNASQHEGKQSRIDFIDLFLDAETDGSAEELANLNFGTGIDSRKKLDLRSAEIEKRLSTDEIVQNLILFLLAGYDTTSNTLAYTTYLLATNQFVQDKLLKQIDESNISESPSYEDMQKLTYLDLVMKETLRLYPLAAIAMTRECMEDTVIGGLPIEKGINVQADVWSLHYDPTIWGNDANDFRPERFTSSESECRPAVAWMPFGSGPRLCIGMRLATLEYKLALTKLLLSHRFVTCNETEIPLKIHGVTTTSPKSVYIALQKR